MKIWLFSDIHLPHSEVRFERIFPTIPDADVAVCAGDLVEGDPAGGVDWLARHIRPFMPVVYIAGNHEFYNPRSNMQRLRARAQEAAERLNIHFLDDRYVDIDGTRFFGSTLWTDFNIFAHGNEARHTADMYASERVMNDFRLIREREHSQDLWTAAAALRQHQMSLRWLDEAMGEHFNGQKVVVSHHAPHPLSIARQFSTDPVTAAFVSDLSATMEKFRPNLWLHGHTHTSFDYQTGEGMRVTCNPRGYGRENAREFNPELVIQA